MDGSLDERELEIILVVPSLLAWCLQSGVGVRQRGSAGRKMVTWCSG